MAGAIVKEKKLAPLMQAIDELAEAQDKYMEGEITYEQYAKATDKVVKLRDELGLQSMRIKRRDADDD